ncbi:MAG TPA: type II secretion system minor pseudopilin GspK [Steroidobacteraceae bacterium]|nr:type II secretion system minor pseudopilin GspK [Steroidobacteraceae bacterium]
MKRRPRGIALLTAVILVALAAALATAIGFKSAMTARRAIGVFTVAQGLQFGAGAEAMAAYMLKQDVSNTQDTLADDWAMPYGPTELDAGVTLEANLEDQQSKFNLNNLYNPKDGSIDATSLEEFERLLTLLGLETKWATLLADWIDADGNPSYPDGAEDTVYLALSPAYRTPNMPITSVSELLALPGFGRDRYDKLAPYVAALPPGTAINVCTAYGVVLDALTAGRQEFSLDEKKLKDERAMGCFPTADQFKATLSETQLAGFQNTRIAEKTQYFRLRSWITIGTTEFTLYSLLHRDSQGGRVSLVLRTFGTE